MLGKYFLEGYRAALAGAAIEANPYGYCRAFASAWRQGFIAFND